ncbi:MAG: right-handed parallel beta-helix repeat-containing protein [Phycisphaerae bacterium]|nr:right-handed parallel beta-helix repeat-containing protein [Phycisphaerae bacterium]
MRTRLITASLVMVCCLSTSASAKGAEAPKVISWSNSKTGNEKTVFAVKPGEKITFSIKADGAEKYLWLADKVVQKTAGGASFTWTVPARKGMWTIHVKTTTIAREQWVKQQVVFWNKWARVRKDRKGKSYPEEKQKFIRDMADLITCPAEARKEWTASTFLVRVKPGESIQKAIDSLPPEGGIIELAPGTHEVNNTMYPTKYYSGNSENPHYSILLNKSNVTVYGDRKTILKHHKKRIKRKGVVCFQIPRGGYRNITFRGFRSEGASIAADGVTDFTVKDTVSRSTGFVVRSYQGGPTYSRNIYFINNTMHGGCIGFNFSTNVHVCNNTVDHGSFAIDVNRNNENINIRNNRVTDAIHALRIHGRVVNLHVQENIFTGRNPLLQDGSPQNGIVEKNIFRNGRDQGLIIECQGGVSNYIIRNNLICNNGHWKGHPNNAPGIRVKQWRGSAAREAKIINNVICNNSGDGIRLDDPLWTLDIRNNVIVGNKGYGVNCKRGSLTLGYNDVWNNVQGDYKGCAAGVGDFSKDPLFADSDKMDYHLKSKTGRWDPKAKKWVKDDVTSPCIDAGDPKSKYGNEPQPNGGWANIGAYGNTTEASKSSDR